MFKKLLCFGLLTFSSTSLLAQLIELKPSDLQLPQVSALPGCAVADYGKIVFLTTTNKANVCSGSGWVEVATGGGGGSLTLPYSSTGSFSTQGFQVINSGGGANSSALQGTTLSTLSNAFGVWGSANVTIPTGNNVGIRGSNLSTNGFGYGVLGTHAGTGFGVYGESAFGRGVYGSALGTGGGIGVFGESTGATSVAGYFTVPNNTATAGRFVSPATVNSTGKALHTTGSIRFAGIGENTGFFLKSADANGVAIWDNLARTDTEVLYPDDFVSNRSDNITTVGNTGLSVITIAGGGTSATLYAYLNLPDQSSINSIRLIYFDNDASASILSCALQSSNAISSSWSNVFNGVLTIPSTNSTNIQTVSATAGGNYSDTSHYRIAITTNASGNVAIKGVEINYSYVIDN